MKKWWPLWVMLWLAVLLILCGILTILHPSWFWKWINILLWISLIFSWLSAIVNAIDNQKTKYIAFLFIIGILAVILGIMLIWARQANLVWKLTVWMFALWAFIRWWMLIFFWIQNRSDMPLWRWICTLWWILILLAILTAISATVMADVIWIFVGISIIFDGFALLFFSLSWGEVKVVQAEVISQAEQNEIAQWDVVVNAENTTVANDSNSQQPNQQ